MIVNSLWGFTIFENAWFSLGPGEVGVDICD